MLNQSSAKLKHLAIFLYLASCSVASPDFVVQGMSLKSALHSFSDIQQKQGAKNQLAHYVEHLRDNHAPGFAWDQYWQKLKEQNLLKNMTDKELSLLFSLNNISCRAENLSAFSTLLLNIVQSDPQKVHLIRLELKRLREHCSTTLSDSSFKSFVSFLSLERAKSEKTQIQQERQKALTSTDSALSAPKHSPPQTQNPLSTKYIYTKELQGILLEEWSLKPQKRSWSDILSVVDRDFWPDIRWINWQQDQKEHLKNTLRMEWQAYQHINHLEQDLLWLFQNKNQMADLLALFEYEKYLTFAGALNWPSLVQNWSTQYPKHPRNGNVPVLISLFSRSCQTRDFPPFYQLLKQWEVSNIPNLGFCFNKDIVPKTPSANTPATLAETKSVNQVFSSLPLLDSVVYLLSLYEREKHVRPLTEWENLLANFSKEDWLEMTRLFRKNHDRQNLTRLLDMQARIYKGHIPFLSEDIWSVMQSEDETLSDMWETGYSPSYMNHPQTLSAFWKKVRESHIQPSVESVPCSASYVQNLYRFFAESNKTDMLLKQFRFDQCAEFILEFRKKEWNRLVYLFRVQKDLSANTDLKSKAREGFMPNDQLVWWMARVLSLPYSLTLSIQASTEEGDEWLAKVFDLSDTNKMSANAIFVQKAVSDMSANEWKRFFRIMIDSLKTPTFETKPIMLRYMSRLLQTIYPLALKHSICGFLAQKDSHHLIAEYPPAFIWDLFLQVDWTQSGRPEKRRPSNKRNNNALCAGLIPPKKVNALLLVLSRGIFANLSAEGVPVDIYIEQVKRQADHLTILINKVRAFDKKWTYYFDSQRMLAQWRTWVSVGGFLWKVGGYNMEKGYISDQALVFYFAGMILKKLQPVEQGKATSEDDVAQYLSAGSAPQNPFDSAYRVYLQTRFYLLIEAFHLLND